jgi:hypothetical protein
VNNDLASTFRDLHEFYLKMMGELSEQLRPEKSMPTQIIVESIIRNRNLLVQIEQMNTRIFELKEKWGKFHARLDETSRAEVRTFAAAAEEQAVRLHTLLTHRLQTLKSLRIELKKESDELLAGIHFLNSIKPVKCNYPKFIDSIG